MIFSTSTLEKTNIKSPKVIENLGYTPKNLTKICQKWWFGNCISVFKHGSFWVSMRQISRGRRFSLSHFGVDSPFLFPNEVTQKVAKSSLFLCKCLTFLLTQPLLVFNLFISQPLIDFCFSMEGSFFSRIGRIQNWGVSRLMISKKNFFPQFRFKPKDGFSSWLRCAAFLGRKFVPSEFFNPIFFLGVMKVPWK